MHVQNCCFAYIKPIKPIKQNVIVIQFLVADPDLQIREGRGGHPDPEIRRGGPKNFVFGPSGLSLV